MHDLIPLNLLPVGATALVGAVAGAEDLLHRLAELGLRQGAQVQMVQPGSPCIVRLNGHKLSFRGDEALQVFVAQAPAIGATA